MKFGVMTMALASISLAATGPVLAQQQGKGKQTREEARQNSQGPANANERGIERSNENSVLKGGQSGGNDGVNNRRRGNSQGSANASDRARERANQNSAVQSGMMVHDKNGKMIGRVKEVRRSPTGVVVAIVVVLVVQINGTTQITLTPGSFTIVNNIIIALNIVAPSGS